MIDGYSRKVSWLKCSNKNRVETVCELFLKAFRESVTPLKVRGDMGVENALLAKHVTLSRNSEHNSCFGGRSTHNSRIERFWREHDTTFKNHF